MTTIIVDNYWQFKNTFCLGWKNALIIALATQNKMNCSKRRMRRIKQISRIGTISRYILNKNTLASKLQKYTKIRGEFLRQLTTIIVDNYWQFKNTFCLGWKNALSALATQNKMICSKRRMKRIKQINRIGTISRYIHQPQSRSVR